MRAIVLALLKVLYLDAVRLKKQEECLALAEALEGHPDAKQFLETARAS